MNFILSFFESRLNPYPDHVGELPKHSLGAFIAACLEGSKGWLVLLLVLTAGIGMFEALLFAWMGDIVDWLTTYGVAGFWQAKSHTLMLMLAVLLVSPLWVAVNSMVHFQTLQGNFPMRLRWLFHQRMLGQSMQFYQDEFSGRISAKVMQTALAVRETVVGFADMMTFVLVYFVSIGVVLVSFDWRLLLPFLGWIALFTLALRFFIPRLKDTATRQADARALMTGRVTDAYANISTVKLFSHSKRELNYAKAAMKEFMVTVHAQMRYVTGLEITNHLLNIALIGSVAAISLQLWHAGEISIGAVAAAAAMALRVNGLAHWIMWQAAGLFENLGTVQDGMRTFSQPLAITDAKNAKPLSVTAGSIHFQAVNFQYAGSLAVAAKHTADNPPTTPQTMPQTLLNDFSLHIHAGEKIGLVGRSGAGKSTLVNLLLRFYDINSGSILIDEQNIQSVTQESLRSQIGMVTQDTSLMHRSIRENIAYGKPNATEAEIIAAAKKAHAYEFISTLKDNNGNAGLDTLVGERGVKLSGGQRQRIAIARVMLKNAPILLLDEATSALDSEIEKAITDSLDKLMAGKTVIAIAHRLSTIAALDRLVVLDEGKIVEMGTHDELLANQNLYAKLWAHQSGGFLADEVIS